LKQNEWTRDKNNNAVSAMDETWLAGRFKLFENYCLPSLKAQKCKNFKWLVYFDTDTPESYREKIDSIQRSFENFSPRFIQGMSHLLSSVKADIGSDATDNSVIITTRLDNDDSLSETFIEQVQSFIKNKSIINGVVDVPNGYCLQIKPVAVLSATIQYSNAFVTYVEPYVSGDKLVTVMDKAHGEWAYSVKTDMITKQRLWMQIIHENNIVNKVQGIIVNSEEELQKFNLATRIVFQKSSLWQVIYNNWIKFPLYLIKKKMKNLWIKRRLIVK